MKSLNPIEILESNLVIETIKKIKNFNIDKEAELKQGVRLLTARVFQVDSIPDFVFKINLSLDESEVKRFTERVAVIPKFKDVIERRNLIHLMVPQAHLFSKISDIPCQVIVEQALPLASFNNTRQKEIWDYSIREISLKPLMKKIIEEITLCICETGLFDIRAENIPFLEDGTGLGLVDIERFGKQKQGIEELLRMLTPEFFPLVETIAKENLPEEIFSRINFSLIKRQQEKSLTSDNLLDQFYIKKGIYEGSEEINYNLLGIKEEDQFLYHLLVKIIDEKIKKQNDRSLKAQRYISFSGDDPNLASLENSVLDRLERVLKTLKDNHVIFSWYKLSFYGKKASFMLQC